MAEAEAASAMRLKIVPIRRGPNKGRFGWVLYNDDLLVQSRKTWPTQGEAASDAAAFADAPTAVRH